MTPKMRCIRWSPAEKALATIDTGMISGSSTLNVWPSWTRVADPAARTLRAQFERPYGSEMMNPSSKTVAPTGVS